MSSNSVNDCIKLVVVGDGGVGKTAFIETYKQGKFYAETTMTVFSWSPEAMKDCTMIHRPIEFAVEGSGLWGEAIRQRRPLIVNDYNADHKSKKGLPEGHVPLTNLMVVPFVVEGKIGLRCSPARYLPP